MEDLVAQTGQVQFCTSGTEAFLCFFGNIHPCQHPCTGCLCSVIYLGDMTPGPHLGEELLAGKEPVHQEMQGAVQPVQEINLSLAVMPVISHELADDRVVLLFHMGIVILVIGTGPDNAPRLGQKGSGVRVIPRARQKRTRCPFMNSLPLSAWREMTFPGYLRRHDSRAATT